MKPVTEIVYITGNPWPVCRDCREHVYLDPMTGHWSLMPCPERARP